MSKSWTFGHLDNLFMMNEVSINSKMKLSEHMTLGELTKSKYSEMYNIPSRVAIENLKRVCGWLEVLRFRYNQRYVLEHVATREGQTPCNSLACGIAAHTGVSPCVSQEEEPIVINSGYRSPELNRKVGGAANSNHLTGCAVDIRCYGIEQALRYAVILMDYADERLREGDGTSGMCQRDFDELLIERNKNGNYWLHFAVRPPSQVNRRKIGFLKA